MPIDTLETAEENTSLTKEKLEKLLAKGNVPTLPMVAQKLVELCNDDNANFAQVRATFALEGAQLILHAPQVEAPEA